MKIFDCFMYMNEGVVLDLRLNYLNNFVDKFTIIESLFFIQSISNIYLRKLFPTSFWILKS